jgi:hypothetical protein
VTVAAPRLPHRLRVEARLAARALPDPAADVRARLAARLAAPWKGRRVAVAAGSRGIDRYAECIAAVVGALRAAGAVPFVIPAMGSHGGGTPAGQAQVLEALGVTETSVGAAIVPDTGTVELGRSELGFRVLAARSATDADAVVLVNRVKPHTDFASLTLGSGLRKMTAIGLGKIEGAFECHRACYRLGFERVLAEAARFALARLPPVLGVALVEDGHHRLARVEVLEASEFEAREPELLAQAREWMPLLPFPEIDLLVLDEIGKNVSGSGMDTNVVGRGVDGLPRPDCRTAIRSLYVRRLTRESHGNAIGMGLADVVHQRVVESLDPLVTFTNALSSMTPATVRTPMHFASDAECLGAALRISGVDPDAARIVRARNTLALDRLEVSLALLPQVQSRADLQVIEPAAAWSFDAAGELQGEPFASAS